MSDVPGHGALMAAAVVELGAHDNMTCEEALALASREEWDEVMIVGYHKGDPSLVVRSSAMKRRDAVWLAEFAKLHAMGVVSDD